MFAISAAKRALGARDLANWARWRGVPMATGSERGGSDGGGGSDADADADAGADAGAEGAEAGGAPALMRFPSAFPLRTVLPLRCAIAEPRCTAALYEAAWLRDRDVGDAAVARDVLRAAGFDADAVLARAQDAGVKAALRANTAEAEALGCCGVPSFVVVGGDDGWTSPVVWGQDRLDGLVADMLCGWRPGDGAGRGKL